MPATLEQKTIDLLRQKNFAHVATHREDGSILNVVVWVDADADGKIYLNSAEGRAWPANVARDPKLTISVHNSENPYEYAAISGTVVDSDTTQGDAHIDALAKKYMDVDSYPFRKEGEVRIKYTIEADRVMHFGA